MKKKSVILLSGGLDSSVNLYAALQETEVVLAVTINYGQRAFESELLAAKKICSALKIPHQLIELPWLAQITNTSLVSVKHEIPVGEQVQIDNYEQSLITAKAVWVPNRNGVLLNVAAAVAESLNADQVVVGFNKEEAQTFPDNSANYLESLNVSFCFSTATHVKVHSYTLDLNKTEIVKLGKNLKINFKELWPCYFVGEKICKQCESCQRFLRAMKSAGVDY